MREKNIKKFTIVLSIHSSINSTVKGFYENVIKTLFRNEKDFFMNRMSEEILPPDKHRGDTPGVGSSGINWKKRNVKILDYLIIFLQHKITHILPVFTTLQTTSITKDS